MRAAGVGQLGDLAAARLMRFDIAVDELGLGDPADPPARDDVQQHPSLGRRRAAPALVAERPHPLEIVEAAHFGAEQVDDDVAGVDQHPVGGGQAFDRGRAGRLRP